MSTCFKPTASLNLDGFAGLCGLGEAVVSAGAGVVLGEKLVPASPAEQVEEKGRLAAGQRGGQGGQFALGRNAVFVEISAGQNRIFDTSQWNRFWIWTPLFTSILYLRVQHDLRSSNTSVFCGSRKQFSCQPTEAGDE